MVISGTLMIDRRPLQRLTYGMFIVTARHEERSNGQTSNTVFQVASEPPLISIAINRENVTHRMIAESGAFTVSILDISAPFELIGLFGFRHGDRFDKFKEVPHRPGTIGGPIITSNTNAFLEATVIGSIEAGTHTVFLGKVIDMGLLSDRVSMTYDFYHNVMKGLTPPSAPTYVPLLAGDR